MNQNELYAVLDNVLTQIEMGQKMTAKEFWDEVKRRTEIEKQV
jgi:hypothetical protein